MKRILERLAWLVMTVVVAGCSMTLEYGRWTDPARLDELRLGESDSAEILKLLGKPTGKGEGRMPDFPGKATVWSYEQQRASGGTTETEVEMNMLMVFIRDGVYQGHFWFEAQGQGKTGGVKR